MLTTVLIISLLYLIGMPITYFILLVLACREYKRDTHVLCFDEWRGEDSIVFASVWPFFLVAVIIVYPIRIIEKYIKRCFDIE